MAFDLTPEALLYPHRRPVFADRLPESPNDGRTFSPALGWYLANISHAAYLDREEILEPLARGGFELLGRVAGGSTHAFVARGERFVVLAFRGTETGDVEDYLTDGDCRLVEHDRVRVHHGFDAALDLVWPQIEDLLAERPGSLPLCFTGHSLGGALAQLAARRLPPDLVCTFGAPRVGDQALARALAGVPVVRVENCCDIVPNLPVEALGYVSLGRRAFIDAAGNLLWEVSFARILAERTKAEARYTKELALLYPNKLINRWLVDHSIVNYEIALRTLCH